MTGPNPQVRFDPAQRMTLVFEQPGAKSVLSVTVELAPGQLQGTLKLKADGWWNARIIVGEEGDGFTLVLHDVFLGTPAFEADDGRFYALRLETEPREPVAASEFLVRAILVDAATGEPLPEKRWTSGRHAGNDAAWADRLRSNEPRSITHCSRRLRS